MQNQIRQPIITPRAVSSRNPSHLFDKTLPGSFEESVNALLPRKQSFLPKNPPALTHQASFKNAYMLYKIDPNIVPQLLEKYTQANLFYRDEEFSQQADMFLTKMAIERKIPDEFRVRFPLYQILVCLSKIFMLNEFELTVFSCMLDHCSWNLNEVLSVDEGNYLREFPSNFGLEIGNECKRFIIYLLIIAFSLKQYLGEKNEVDQIQSYCEHICNNFQTLYNKWLRVAPANRFSFSLQEINRKYRFLAKRDVNGFQSSVKDYNMMVDEIMGLTGSYTARTKETRPPGPGAGHFQAYEEQTRAYVNPKQQIFHEFNFQPPVDTRPSQSGISVPFIEDRRQNFEQPMQNNIDIAPIRMPSFLANLSKQPSYNYNNMLNNPPLNKNHPSFIDNSMPEESGRKKLREDHGIPHLQNQLSLVRGASHYKPIELQQSYSNLFKNDDIMGMNLPNISKNLSTLSQDPEEPGLTRFQSNLSFLYDT